MCGLSFCGHPCYVQPLRDAQMLPVGRVFQPNVFQPNVWSSKSHVRELLDLRFRVRPVLHRFGNWVPL